MSRRPWWDTSTAAERKADRERAKLWKEPRHTHAGTQASMARTFIPASASVDGRARLIWRCEKPGCRAVFTRVVSEPRP